MRSSAPSRSSSASRSGSGTCPSPYDFGLGSTFDVVAEDGDLNGDGVNIAARLEQLADPEGVMVSGAAYDHLRSKLGCGLEYLGEQRLKNIEQPVRVYRVLLNAPTA